MKIDYLEELACRFREALDDVIDEKLYGRLNIFLYFPKECCRYTSDLLAEYMMDNGISRERIQMVESETVTEEYTHCWLMVDNVFYVDITADQFNENGYFSQYEPIPKCYVVLKNRKNCMNILIIVKLNIFIILESLLMVGTFKENCK